MQTIQKLTQQSCASLKKSNAPAMPPRGMPPIDADHLIVVWDAMRNIFGKSKWEREYGTKDNGTWLRGLQDLSREQLDHGVTQAACQTGNAAQWPPTLPVFRGWCCAVDAALIELTATQYMPCSFDRQTMSHAQLQAATKAAHQKAMRDINETLRRNPQAYWQPVDVVPRLMQEKG